MNLLDQVLITGGTGFFGRHCVRELLKRGASRVCILSRDEHKQAAMRAEFDNDDHLRFFIGDVRDVARLRRAFDGVSLVIHAAAIKRVEVAEYDPGELIKTNVIGATNVVEAATDARVKRVVALSTDKACDPVNAYGASKLLAEKLFIAANNGRGKYGPLCSVVRYGNVWNSTGSVVPRWRDNLRTSKVVPVTSPECTRFFMRASEAVDLVLTTAEKMRGGELMIPDLPAYRLGDLAEAMGARMNIIGLDPREKLHESMRTGATSERARRMSVAELRVELAKLESEGLRDAA